MEQAQDRIQWRALVLAVLKLRGSATRMDLRETGCKDGRWIKQAQDRVQWRALVLAVLNFLILLPEG
jgi:hypothetical protein